MHSWLSPCLFACMTNMLNTLVYRRVGFLSSQGKRALRSFARCWVALPCGQGSVFHGSGAPGGARRALRRFWIGGAVLLPWRDLLQDARRSGTFMEWRPGFIRAVRDVLQVVRDGAEGFWAEASSFQGLAKAFWSSEECGKALGSGGLW